MGPSRVEKIYSEKFLQLLNSGCGVVFTVGEMGPAGLFFLRCEKIKIATISFLGGDSVTP
jgi:hypothetical protein